MKHRELTNHIRGSYLKQQYLEAFLVQSAYIESLLRTFADWNLFLATVHHTDQGHSVIAAAREQLTGMDLRRVIAFCKDAKLISTDQSRQLNTYRDRRNKTIHDLVSELRKEEFDTELKRVCDLGDKLIQSRELVKIGEMLDGMEKDAEQKESREHFKPKSPPKDKVKRKKKKGNNNSRGHK